MDPRQTEEPTPGPHRNADSAAPVDRRPGVSFATKRGFLAQGRSSLSDARRRASRKNSPAGSSDTNTGPTYVPGTKSAIKRLAPITPPQGTGSTPPPSIAPRSSTYRPNLQELGVRVPEYRQRVSD